MTEQLDSQYWNNRYRKAETGWDIGYASPPLTTYFDQLTDKHKRILIPGCGNAYEVGYLLNNAFRNITVIDIAPDLTAALAEKFASQLGKELTIYTGDFFEHEGCYELIIEQTFFCALDPSLRNKYAEKMAELLVPGGKLVGLLFNRAFEGGPPFGGSKEAYESIFSGSFSRRSMEPCYNSIPPRKDAELFIQLVK